MAVPVLLFSPIDVIKYSNQTAKDYSNRNVNYGRDWEYDVEYYEQNGNRIYVPQYTYWTLTTNLRTWEDCIELLDRDGIAIYDPTNGLYSNGDIIIHPWLGNIYSKYTSKLLF